MNAPTPRARALWARRGLALRQPLDRVVQAMLLRQLYIAHFEERRFERAVEIGEQVVALGVLEDVARQDVARALVAKGDLDAAAGHLRLAARKGPAHRRAFHLWTLGTVMQLAGRLDEAASVMARAARWGTTDKPLYEAHLAVIEAARGERVGNLAELFESLRAVPAGQGYGRFILGQLAYHARRWDDARRHLEAFVERSQTGRAALAISLEREVAAARSLLHKMRAA